MPAAANVDALSVTFAALADPTRRAILARLAERDATVNELAALFPAISLQAVSKHLKVLERAGLVTRGRNAQQRPAHLRTEPFADAGAWLEHLARPQNDPARPSTDPNGPASLDRVQFA